MWQQLKMIWGLMRGQRLRYAGAIGALFLATLFAFLVPLVGRSTIDGAITEAVQARQVRAKAGDGVRAEADLRVQAVPGVQAVPWAPARRPSMRLDVAPLLGGRSFLAQHLWIAAVAMVSLMALAGSFSYLKGRLAARACESIARNLRNRLYDHLQHLPCTYHDKADTGDLVQRCTSDVETLRWFLAAQVLDIGNAVILLLTVLPIMLCLDARLTAVSLALVPIIVVFAVVFFLKVKRRFKEVDEAEGKMTTVVQENLTGIRVVRAFARQDFERRKFAVPNANYRDRQFRLIRLMAWYWSSSDLICMSQMGLALIVGGYWVARGRTTVGTLFAFLAYLQMVVWPMRQMARTLTELGKAMVSFGRMREILNQPRESGQEGPPNTGSELMASPLRPINRLTDQPINPSWGGSIAIRNLTFAYGPGKPVLSDLSLMIPAGQTLGILGPSGSGKSTLIHLLLRLYDYEQGSIQLDGRELRGLDRTLVRRQIGVVLQEPFLFSKTLKENIRHGRTEAPDDQIAAAAEAACIHDTIVSFEKGYDTLIGERGVTLSGGQRQRLAIARALVRDPALLIFDDALSAVDSQTEALILRALEQRRGKRTSILIAHRLGTLMSADQIAVLQHGRITQLGPHDELVAQPGLYRQLWQIQSAQAQDLERELASV